MAFSLMIHITFPQIRGWTVAYFIMINPKNHWKRLVARARHGSSDSIQFYQYKHSSFPEKIIDIIICYKYFFLTIILDRKETHSCYWIKLTFLIENIWHHDIQWQRKWKLLQNITPMPMSKVMSNYNIKWKSQHF